MNRSAFLLVLALSLPSVARADDASHRAKAEELITLQNVQKSVSQVAERIRQQINEIADRTAGPNPSPEAKTKVSDFEKQAGQMIDTQIGWAALHPRFTDIYVKSFTEEELDAIVAFYKTPAGNALITKMPEVNSQMGQLGQSRVEALQPQLQQLLTDFRKSMTPPAAAAPATPSAPASAPAPRSAPPK